MWKQGDHLEAYHSSDPCLEYTYTYIYTSRKSDSGSDEKQMDRGHILEVEPVQPADILNVGCGKGI